jgi:hypothetical protein
MESKNDFQKWLELQGYFRKKDSSLWYDKDFKIVNGAILAKKLKEWKEQ